jgi:hypothetical protein
LTKNLSFISPPLIEISIGICPFRSSALFHHASVLSQHSTIKPIDKLPVPRNYSIILAFQSSMVKTIFLDLMFCPKKQKKFFRTLPFDLLANIKAINN